MTCLREGLLLLETGPNPWLTPSSSPASASKRAFLAHYVAFSPRAVPKQSSATGKAQTVQASALMGWGGSAGLGGQPGPGGCQLGSATLVVAATVRGDAASKVCAWGCHCTSCDVRGARFPPTWSMNQTKNLQTSGAAAARGKQGVPGGN